MTVHLHVQSCYSLLDSTIRIRELVSQAKTMGYKAVALTDHRVMSGMAAFLHGCTDAGIKPIAGLQADCDYHGSTVTFLLICGDNVGYQNLMKLSSILCTQDAPCTLEQLQQACHHNTLIVYGEGGWMDHVLLSANDHRREISEMLAVLQEDFPSFYVALSYQESALWNTSNRILKNICRSRGIRTVALNKIFYLQEEDVYAYQALQAIAAHGTLQDPGLSLQKGRSFLSPQQMEALYDQDDLDATEEIAAMCTADYRLPPAGLPAFPVPAGFTSRTYLEQLCKAGLNKRMHGHVTKEYADRLKMELGVIEHMHFEDYFLIVYDYVRFGRTHGILIGPGRGSAAGSLVAYCLGITMVDPIPYHLLFERFLNPERVSMPDIDIDFCYERRQEVIDYVVRKYGAENVAQIVTFG
ncbi:MAG: PHP domain-containing protein, partial [Erysipelotrichaceae bacterium]|nr:PHP domain-containing protein [Erysipelotrichaceae bacterium]